MVLKVFNNQDFWSDLYNDPMPESVAEEDSTQKKASDEIPASDRIVLRSDNRPTVELIEADLRGLVDEIETNNEAGAELGEERELVTGELKAAETLLSQPAFRFARLSTLVLPVLRFLVEKFATGAIGEMAKRLIAAIFGLG